MHAGMASPPRDAWPCALVTDDPAAGGARSVFRYGERTSCRLPRAVAAFGVIGCPDAVELTDDGGAVETRTFEYDDAGHMVRVRGDVTRGYTWQDDRLIAVTREHGAIDRASYLDRTATETLAVDEHGDTRELLELDGDRLVRWVEHAQGRSSTTVLEWSGDRPTKLRDTAARTFLYECSAQMLRDSAGAVPRPDAEIAALPVDVRLATWAASSRRYQRDCTAFRARPCEIVGDFDGDGEPDRAVKIRERGRRGRAGIAIRWGTGDVSIIAAGVASRQLSTDVHMDGIDLAWELATDDLDFLVRWAVVPRSGDGFSGAGPPRAVGGGSDSPAPQATGDGILVDGGDAAEVIYWDGARWRLLVLGY